jgi:excisionase family DNA binding protein
MTTRELADQSGIPRERITKAIHRGDLPAKRVKRHYAVEPNDFRAWERKYKGVRYSAAAPEPPREATQEPRAVPLWEQADAIATQASQPQLEYIVRRLLRRLDPEPMARIRRIVLDSAGRRGV